MHRRGHRRGLRRLPRCWGRSQSPRRRRQITSAKSWRKHNVSPRPARRWRRMPCATAADRAGPPRPWSAECAVRSSNRRNCRRPSSQSSLRRSQAFPISLETSATEHHRRLPPSAHRLVDKRSAEIYLNFQGLAGRTGCTGVQEMRSQSLRASKDDGERNLLKRGRENMGLGFRV